MQIPSFRSALWISSEQTVPSKSQQTPTNSQSVDTVHFSAWYDELSPHHSWPRNYAFRLYPTSTGANSPHNINAYKEYSDADLSKLVYTDPETQVKYGLSHRAWNDLNAAEIHAQNVRMGILGEYLMDEEGQRQLRERIKAADEAIRLIQAQIRQCR